MVLIAIGVLKLLATLLVSQPDMDPVRGRQKDHNVITIRNTAPMLHMTEP